MTELILQPHFGDKTRKEIEDHLVAVRARRMVAAIAYQEAARLKLDHETEQIKRRLDTRLQRLNNDIGKLDALMLKIEQHLVEIETFYQEIGLSEAMLTLAESEGEDE